MAAPLDILHSYHQASVNTMQSGHAGDDLSVGNSQVVPGFALGGTGVLEFDISGHSLATGWINFHMTALRQDAGRSYLIMAGATTDLFRIQSTTTSTSGGTQTLEYWDGSAWQNIGTISQLQNAASRIDIFWDIHDSTGSLDLYVDGVLDLTFSGDTLHTADTTIDTLKFGCPDASTSYQTDISPIVVDDVDTRGLVWDNTFGTSNGTHQEWAGGGVTEVDAIIYATNWQIGSLTTDADGERFTLNFPAIDPAFAGYAAEAVVLLCAGTAQSEPGLYLKGLMRKSAIDYLGPEVAGGFSTTPYTVVGATFMDDPATAIAWVDQAAVESFEMGFQASTTA